MLEEVIVMAAPRKKFRKEPYALREEQSVGRVHVQEASPLLSEDNGNVMQ